MEMSKTEMYRAMSLEELLASPNGPMKKWFLLMRVPAAERKKASELGCDAIVSTYRARFQ